MHVCRSKVVFGLFSPRWVMPRRQKSALTAALVWRDKLSQRYDSETRTCYSRITSQVCDDQKSHSLSVVLVVLVVVVVRYLLLAV